MNIYNKFVSFGLAVFVFAPALKVRFQWDDLFVYYIAFGAFVAAVLVGNTLRINQIGPRLGAASVFLLLFAGPFYAFLLFGAVDTGLMATIFLNVSVGILVVLYPWDENSLNSLLQAFAVIGSIISVNTMLFYGSDDAIIELRQLQTDGERTTAYLTATFAMGVGVICSSYFLVKNFSLFTISVFGLNWLGVALGRGRGAFLFCVVVAIIYLLVAMNSRIAQFSRTKKMIMFLLILSFIPIVFQQVLKLSRMREGIARILFAPEVEAAEGGRGSAFSQGIESFMYSPVLGNGLGAYHDNDFGHPHNLLISWGVDSGLIGLVLLGLFFFSIVIMFFRSVRVSNERNINIVYVMGALCAYMFLNYMKSYDPYINREMYLFAALPIVAYVVVTTRKASSSRRRRRRTVRFSRSV